MDHGHFDRVGLAVILFACELRHKKTVFMTGLITARRQLPMFPP
ncbi:hypothetical protein CIT292_08720 [Citrobacter youngae ATCC 29220]|uniref:Uncharacterized protein n=1 Tax=Citrobacter youngae ATCC 29220 TaxID=500640 RepID=D4BE01_9ENTR|nr:hypothetical protein CIT292_08720 [Citrobacter youngae ATCC 29220]